MKCKHKNHEHKNIDIGGWNIPDGCVTEYDIYCKDCGRYLGHWAYGYDDIGEYEYYNKWYRKLLNKIRILFIRIKSKFIKDNDILPF